MEEEKKARKTFPPGCLLPKEGNGCDRPQLAVLLEEDTAALCVGCGWNSDEFAARKKLPFQQDEDGLWSRHFAWAACRRKEPDEPPDES